MATTRRAEFPLYFPFFFPPERTTVRIRVKTAVRILTPARETEIP